MKSRSAVMRPSALDQEIYLDNNSTTRVLPEVVEAVATAMGREFGNPSSVHRSGSRARRVIRGTRERVAELLNAKVDEVVFTSGATESNNLVLQSLLGGPLAGFELVTTSVEHSSILQTAVYLRAKGISVTILDVDSGGRLDPEKLLRAIKPGRTLVSVQWANNETGVIQPIPGLASLARSAGAFFHTDAAQAAGKIRIDLSTSPVDFLSLSGHKVHGPLGVGAVVGPGINRLLPLAYGGSQEKFLRPGTENVPAIAGLGVAFEVRSSRFDLASQLTMSLRDRFESQLISSGLAANVNGDRKHRLPNTSNVRFAGVDGEAFVIRLDQRGVRCSQSSACTNQKPEPSYVLRAMGLTEAEAYASVRFGFSEFNTEEEVDLALEKLSDIHASLARFAVV